MWERALGPYIYPCVLRKTLPGPESAPGHRQRPSQAATSPSHLQWLQSWFAKGRKLKAWDLLAVAERDVKAEVKPTISR